MFEGQLGTFCVILTVDLGMKAECGMKSTTLYMVVDEGPTATRRSGTNMVKIDEKDSACSTQPSVAGAGGWHGGR
jgi:hypothetical protein